MHMRICYASVFILSYMHLDCMWTCTAIGTGTCDGLPSAGEGDSLQIMTQNTIVYLNIDMNMMNNNPDLHLLNLFFDDMN